MMNHPNTIDLNGQEPLVLTNWKLRLGPSRRLRRRFVRGNTPLVWLKLAGLLPLLLLCRRG